MTGIIVIGDVHAKFDEYYKLARRSKYSIQVGDFGFSHTWNQLEYSNLQYRQHKIIGGNHDDINFVRNSNHSLGGYGSRKLNGIEFFVIRGGISLDRVYRSIHELQSNEKTYWYQEELTFKEMLGCIHEFHMNRPEIVISHTCPGILLNKIHNSSRFLQEYGFEPTFIENTSLMLNECFKLHKPKKWIFGHHHKSFRAIVDGTEFIGLNELEVYEL